jgi:hypothetical protein
MAHGKNNGQARAYTTRVFEEFFRISKDRLEAVKNGLSDQEIPTPPAPQKRRTAVPPAVAESNNPNPFGDR